MLSRCALILGLVAIIITIEAQEFDYNGFDIEKVVFHAPDEGTSFWLKIFNDPLPTYDPATVISLPGAISGDTETIVYDVGSSLTPTPRPVGYVSGSHARVSALFATDCGFQSIYIRGKTDQGFNLPWKLADYNSSTGNFEYDPESFNEIFIDDEVRYFEDFTIKWYISVDQYGAEEYIGETSVELFITHADHKLSDPSNLFHSMLYVGCKNASGKDTDTEIVTAIYDEHKDQCVKKKGGTACMGYWKTGTPLPPQGGTGFGACFTAGALLAYENATCGSLADFLDQLIKAQGIEGSKTVEIKWTDDYKLSDTHNTNLTSDISDFFGPGSLGSTVYTIPTGSPNAMFFVKSWDDTELREFYGHLESPGTTLGTFPGGTLKGADKSGVGGQGNDDPRSFFENHAIVEYGGEYYDPSYGSAAQSSKSDYEDNAIYAFGAALQVVITSPVATVKVAIWPAEENTSSVQLTFK